MVIATLLKRLSWTRLILTILFIIFVVGFSQSLVRPEEYKGNSLVVSTSKDLDISGDEVYLEATATRLYVLSQGTLPPLSGKNLKDWSPAKFYVLERQKIQPGYWILVTENGIGVHFFIQSESSVTVLLHHKADTVYLVWFVAICICVFGSLLILFGKS